MPLVFQRLSDRKVVRLKYQDWQRATAGSLRQDTQLVGSKLRSDSAALFSCLRAARKWVKSKNLKAEKNREIAKREGEMCLVVYTEILKMMEGTKNNIKKRRHSALALSTRWLVCLTPLGFGFYSRLQHVCVWNLNVLFVPLGFLQGSLVFFPRLETVL